MNTKNKNSTSNKFIQEKVDKLLKILLLIIIMFCEQIKNKPIQVKPIQVKPIQVKPIQVSRQLKEKETPIYTTNKLISCYEEDYTRNNIAINKLLQRN